MRMSFSGRNSKFPRLKMYSFRVELDGKTDSGAFSVSVCILTLNVECGLMILRMNCYYRVPSDLCAHITQGSRMTLKFVNSLLHKRRTYTQ